MPVPRLIHPVKIYISALGSETIFDQEFKTPIGQRTWVKYEIPGQVSWEVQAGAAHSAAGAVPEADGYVMFLRKDILAAGWKPRQGDKITQFGEDDLAVCQDVFFVRFQPMGHYPDQGGATLLRGYFRSKAPVQ